MSKENQTNRYQQINYKEMMLLYFLFYLRRALMCLSVHFSQSKRLKRDGIQRVGGVPKSQINVV